MAGILATFALEYRATKRRCCNTALRLGDVMNTRAIIRQLTSEVAERKTQRQALDMEIDALEKAISVLSGNTPPAARSSRQNGSSYANTITNAIHDVLLEERPLRREAILEKVLGKGIHVGGKTPIATLGSYLSTDERFRNVGRGTWTLANEPDPSSNIEDLSVSPSYIGPTGIEANGIAEDPQSNARGMQSTGMLDCPEGNMNPLTGLTP